MLLCCYAAGPQCSQVSQQLWLLLLQLQASESSPDLAAQAAAASQRLAVACHQGSSADLAAMHAPALVADLAQVTAFNVWCRTAYSCGEAMHSLALPLSASSF